MSHSTDHRPETGSYAVVTHRVCKRYGRQTALEGVDLRVPGGAVYVLVGANGAGKSTTFRVLMNLVRPDSGSAEVFGMDTARRGADVRAQTGYVPDLRGPLYPGMSCRRLLAHVSAFYPTWDAGYAEHLRRALGLHQDRNVGTLSKGEARRLQLVLAMAHRPPLLLLDEPTDELDPVARRAAMALLTEHIADTPTTILISTHQLHEVESLADYVGVLRAGRLTAQLSRDELQRTVRRYRVEIPEAWTPPPDLRTAGLRRSSGGREIQWTLVGEERDLIERLTHAGGRVHEAKPLTLEDAALAFLTEDVPG